MVVQSVAPSLQLLSSRQSRWHMALDDKAKPQILPFDARKDRPWLWRKGQSGNPSGPKKLRADARLEASASLEKLVSIRDNKLAPLDLQRKAAVDIWYMGVGKPPTSSTMTVKESTLTREEAEQVIMEVITRTQERRRLAEQQRALAAASGDGQVVDVKPSGDQ